MRTFVEALRETLLATERGEVTSREPAIPAQWARGLLLRLLQRLEAGEGGDDWHAVSAEHALHRWRGDAAAEFCENLGTLVIDHGLAESPGEEQRRLVEVALARELGLPDALESRIATLALDELRPLALDGEHLAAPRYSVEVGLERSRGGRREVTPVGSVFLQVTGREQLRWLLHLEAIRSTGPHDRWRASREAAATLLRGITVHFDDAWDYAMSPATLKRLRDMGVLEEESLEWDFSHFAPTPVGRALLAEVARDEPSPLSVMARTMLDDLTVSLAPAASRSRELGAVEAVARQARLVAHELNNTLVPVRSAVGQLARELTLKPAEEVLPLLRPRIDRGLDSAFRFIKELSDVSRLVGSPSTVFDLEPAIRDALAEVGAGSAIEWRVDPATPPIRGLRPQFVRAVVNLLRNALTAAQQDGPRVAVIAKPIRRGKAARLVVEDNGPGVPPSRRDVIFDDGISHKPGGLGLGLGLVRSIVADLGGAVSCDTSERLGGARFTLTLPAAGTTS